MGLQSLHHAQLVEGTKDVLPAVLSFLKDTNFPTEGNPDLWVREFNRFGVEEARVLGVLVGNKPVQYSRRVFIVAAALITPEAQNALLKTLEEPGGNALIIIVVPQAHRLLPTLRSRMHVLQLAGILKSTDAKDFLAADQAGRLACITALLKKDGDERDMHRLAAFLDSLERELAPRVQKKGVLEGLRALYSAKQVVSDQSVAMKPLLEYMALSLPTV